MAMAVRKLQAEIDRTLKAVAQGVETFESTFDKLNHASNATQKDKLENDLKTQIKKLQRMRDQIKAWLGSSDIKDKSALLENRKLIETQMERFKALEKEMKMKAFSKEGLIAQSRLDPAEKAKRDVVDWIGTTTDELSRQIEQTEAEVESLQSSRKKKAQGERLGELEELNERRQWHIGRLEVVQRMLENGQLSVDQVEFIQEDVKYFVEANDEEDFDYDVGIYDELNLQEEDDFIQDYSPQDEISNLDSASVADASETASAPPPKTPAKEEKEKKGTPAKLQSVEEPPSPAAAKKVPSKKATVDVKVASPATEKTPAKSDTSATAKVASLPPIRYAAAAAAAVAGTAASALSLDASPAKAKEGLATTPPAEAEVDSEALAPELESDVGSVADSKADIRDSQSAPPFGVLTLPSPGVSGSEASASLAPLANTLQASSSTVGNGPNSNAPPGYAAPTHAESSRAAAAFSASPAPTQGVMGNLMQSFDMAKEISERRGNDVNELNAALEGSYANAPHQIDAEPPRYYHPSKPIKTPSYYPQTRWSACEDKTVYARLDIDQLFYVFYYMPGTYEQWLAAQELKRQSWRFHKQYLTWFQRAHQPQAITEDYEQGGYFYFDWENSWCQRKKSDFRFEYRWLSDH